MQPSAVPGGHSSPAFRFALLFIVGIVIGDHDVASLEAVASLVVCLALVAIASSLRLRDRVAPHVTFLTSSLLLVSLGVLRIESSRHAVPIIPDGLLMKQIKVVGMVVDPPTVREKKIRCVIRTAVCIIDTQVIPLNVTLTATVVPSPADTAFANISYGMTLALYGRLSIPGPEHNPGEFNPRRFCEANGIEGFLFVRGAENLRVLDSMGGSWIMRNVLAPSREAILRQIDETVGGEEGEFLKGLMIGDRSGIGAATSQAFMVSGVAHVLAVSGSNVAVVAMIFIFLYDFFRLPARCRALVVAAGLLLYMVVTGSQPPVVRATIMALVFLLGRVVQRRSDAYNALGLSALVILVWDGRQLFDVGFQLSFGAVLSIVHLYPRANLWISRIPDRGRWRRAVVWLLRLCAVSLVAMLGTLPMTALYFGRVSIIGILANIPVIPATGLSVILGAASIVSGLVSPWAASMYGTVNSLLLFWTMETARYAAAFPFASVDAFRFSTVDALPFYAGLGLVFHWQDRKKVRVLVIALLLSLNIACYSSGGAAFPGHPGLLRVSVIDVGQGDAVLVEFPTGGTMLIDGGPWSLSNDAGERTVAPFLKRRGISRIDLLVVTHPHGDHIGGIPFLVRHFDVGKVVESGQAIRSGIYNSYLQAIARRGCPSASATMGMMLEGIPDVRLYVLFPERRFIESDTSHAHPNLNNTSVVIRLVYGEVSFLFAGDAEEEAEEVMVNRYGGFLRSTLLKAGHHGSITSSSEIFLDAVRPPFVVISVGLNNRFHHPSPIVLQRYGSRHTTVARTDQEGAVIMETDGRTLHRVFWR